MIGTLQRVRGSGGGLFRWEHQRRSDRTEHRVTQPYRGGRGRRLGPDRADARRQCHRRLRRQHLGQELLEARHFDVDLRGDRCRRGCAAQRRLDGRGVTDDLVAPCLALLVDSTREREGDLLAQWSANRLGARRLVERAREHSAAELRSRARQLMDWTERLTRASETLSEESAEPPTEEHLLREALRMSL